MVTDVYPSLWERRFASDGRDSDNKSAFAVVAAWLKRADADRSLPQFLNPPLEPKERKLAAIEEWILGWFENVWY